MYCPELSPWGRDLVAAHHPSPMVPRGLQWGLGAVRGLERFLFPSRETKATSRSRALLPQNFHLNFRVWVGMFRHPSPAIAGLVPHVLRTCGLSFQRSVSENSLVAMDFSGQTGRVIENPAEAQSAALEEGHAWRVRPGRPVDRPPHG